MPFLLHIGIGGVNDPRALAFQTRERAAEARREAWDVRGGDLVHLADDFGTEMSFQRRDLRTTMVMEVRDQKEGLARPGP